MPTKTKTKAKTDVREQGIKAIIALQAFAGIKEPRERAEKNWDAFSKHQKEQTLLAYKTLCE